MRIKQFYKHDRHLIDIDALNRGGVEDTGLEKAKDIKKSEAKDSPTEDRPCQGQGQECSRPRIKNIGASVLYKKKVFKNFFLEFSKKKTVYKKILQAIYKLSTIQKIVLSSSRGQGRFRGLEALRPRPRTSKCVLEAKDVLEDSTSGTQNLRTNETKNWQEIENSQPQIKSL